MRFTGNVIITDPMYFLKSDEDWQAFCDVFENGDDDIFDITDLLNLDISDTPNQPLKQFGVEPAIVISSDEAPCEVFDDKGEKIGEFCSDSAIISICLLDDVLKYNPNYDAYANDMYKHTVAVINGFDGNIEIEDAIDGSGSAFSIVGKGNIDFRTM
jgi:hypothetical protein